MIEIQIWKPNPKSPIRFHLNKHKTSIKTRHLLNSPHKFGSVLNTHKNNTMGWLEGWNHPPIQPIPPFNETIQAVDMPLRPATPPTLPSFRLFWWWDFWRSKSEPIPSMDEWYSYPHEWSIFFMVFMIPVARMLWWLSKGPDSWPIDTW